VANNLLSTQKILFRALARLSNNLQIWPNLYDGYDKEFGQPGAKVGRTVEVRKPQRFVGADGALFQPEALDNMVTPVSVTQQSQVSFQADTMEDYFSIEDWDENYIKPAAERLANKLDFAAAQYMAQRTWNSVGTQGTTPTGTTAFHTYLTAARKLKQNLAPKTERCLVINADASTEVVDQLKGQFNPQANISRMFQKNMMGRDTGGMDWYESENLASLTAGIDGAGGTPVTSAANQTGTGGNNGSQNLTVSGFAATATVNQGDVFHFADVFMTNAGNYQQTPVLQQFVVEQTVTLSGSGTGTLVISPAITPSGQYQNVSAAPGNNDTLIFDSVSSTSGTQYLAFHKTSYAVVSVPGKVPGGTDMAYQERDPETGIWLRFIRDFDTDIDIWKCRFDVYWGISPLYREHACRIQGA
jgi:hypothetical protein